MKKNNFKSLMQAAVLICTPLVIASCDDVFGDVDNPIPSHLTVSQAAVNLELHADRPDAATFIRKGIAATGAQLVYSSSDEKVATVDANGKITGVGEGECQIIVKATGLDSNGKQTYQEAEESFTVKVKDYRARIELIEGAEIPVFNSADASLAEIDLSKVIKVWPANVNIDFDEPVYSGVISIVQDPTTKQESIQLTGTSGTAKVTAAIDPTEATVNKKLFETYENKSFPKNQITEEFEITVKDGVAYIAGYELKNNKVTPVRKTMFKDYNNEKYTLLSEAAAAQPSGDLTLNAGWYVVDNAATSLTRNIRVKGDVNLIMSNDLDMNGNIILDQSAEKSYELNIISDYDNPYNQVYDINKIQDFKKVTVDRNLYFNIITDPNFKNIGTLNVLSSYINGWKFENIGTLDIADANLDGTTSEVSFKTVNSLSISESWLYKVSFNTVTALNIADATSLDWTSFAGVNSLNITNKAVLNVGNCTFTTIGTFNASKVNFGTTTFKKTIGTLGLTDATLNPTFGAGADAVTFGAINLKKSNMTCAQVVLKDGGAITLDGGTFAATATGDNYAVKGNVVVNKGTFTASSPDFHAVKGNMTGTTFYETNVATPAATDWSAITGTTSQEPYVKGEKE